MLGENIRVLRRQKGLSQETLAQRLNVVRQTVSKWEKGLSVPDAEMLNTLSELFEVPVSTLLGSTIEEAPAENGLDEVAKQLAVLNEQLAADSARRRKTRRRVLIGIPAVLVLFIVLWIAGCIAFKVQTHKDDVFTTVKIECTLDGESYDYTVVYDQDFRIHESGGDSFISSHVDVLRYDDANVLLAQIEDYFTERGGTYKIMEASGNGIKPAPAGHSKADDLMIGGTEYGHG